MCKPLFDVNFSNIFFNPFPRVMETTKKKNTEINKWTQLNSEAFAQQRKP